MREWEEFARDCVADLRAAAARYPDDDAIRALVARLRRHSDLFAEWWEEHQLRTRRGGHKRFHHPAVGELDLDADVLLVPDRDQRVIIDSAPPGSPSAQALRVVGTERMAP